MRGGSPAKRCTSRGEIGSHPQDLAQRKIKLAGSPAVDGGPQIDLNRAGDSFFLKASMKVGVPGVDREVAQELAEAAHGICPYSKAVHGNIEVSTTII